MDRYDYGGDYRHDEHYYSGREFSRLPIHSRQVRQLPSFGMIPEEEPIERPVNTDSTTRSRLVRNRSREPMDIFQRQKSFSQFRNEESSLAQQVADLKMMAEMEVVRKQQLEALESLKTEIRDMKQFGGLSTAAMDRISSIDSSSYQESSSPFENQPTTKEVLLNGQKKNLEMELSSRLREIERLLIKERELQNTIHQLQMELDCRIDEKEVEEAKKEVHRLEVSVERLKSELKEANVERERLAFENGNMKKQLLRKYFETKLFLEDSNRSNDKQLTELSRRCEDLNEMVNQLKNDMTSRSYEAEARLAEQQYKFNTNLKDNLEQMQSKHFSFCQQMKEDLGRLDRLKTKIVKEVKYNRMGFDSFDTEVEYERILGGLIARIEHLPNGKCEVPLNQGSLKSSSIKPFERADLVAQLEQRNSELESKNAQLFEEANRLAEFIEKENQAKRRFLGEIYDSKMTHQAVLRERDALKREINDLRVVIKYYQKIAETNTFLEGELARLRHSNEQLTRECASPTPVGPVPSEMELGHLRQQYQELSFHRKYLEEQCSRLTKQLEELKNTVQFSEEEKRYLSSKLEANAGYINQIESALMQVQPKLPDIFRKRAQHITEEVDEQQEILADRVDELEQEVAHAKATIAICQVNQTHLQESNKQLQNEVQKLQAESLRLSLENGELRYSRDQLIDQHQRYISKLALDQEHSRAESVQSQLEVELKQCRTTLQRHEDERAEYVEVIQELTRENSRKEEELKTKYAYIHSRELALEKEVVRLTAEAAALRRNHDIQIERLSNSGSDASKGLAEHYQRYIQQLQLTIQQQQQELSKTHGLQLQLGQLQLLARYLAQSKERSMAVDHLWEIKQVEFGNAMAQLAQLRAAANLSLKFS